MSNMIKAEQIDKTFKQGTKLVHAIKGASMDIPEGERVYVHGPSGAGKSTLLQVLGGLSRPTEGKVFAGESDVYALSDRKRSRLRNNRFGFIFQFYHLLPELSILENVMLPAMIKGAVKGKEVKKRALSLLDKVGLSDRVKHRPSQVSGGEAQRTAIARALINSPGILFCDEPTGNLDSEMSDKVYTLLRDISEEEKMSVVVVSHQEVIEDFAHAEYAMKDGLLEKVVQHETRPLRVA